MAPRADPELLDAWAAGDATAGNELLTRHFDTLYRFFASKAPDAAEDLVQETLLASLAARSRYEGSSTFRSFLIGVARNCLLRFLRASSRKPVTADRDSVEQCEVNYSDLLDARREQRLLLRALRRIPINAQITIELHYWEGLSVTEAAEVLAIAPGTVKSRLFRARALLRDAIDDAAQDPETATNTLQNFDHWIASLKQSFDGGSLANAR